MHLPHLSALLVAALVVGLSACSAAEVSPEFDRLHGTWVRVAPSVGDETLQFGPRTFFELRRDGRVVASGRFALAYDELSGALYSITYTVSPGEPVFPMRYDRVLSATDRVLDVSGCIAEPCDTPNRTYRRAP